MLVLTRRVYEGLQVWDETGRYIGRITIEGMEQDHRPILGRVKLGLDLDSRFTILRDELVQGVESSHAHP